MNAASSIPSASKFPQTKVAQGPRYDRRPMFRRKLRRGRPGRREKREYWVK